MWFTQGTPTYVAAWRAVGAESSFQKKSTKQHAPPRMLFVICALKDGSQVNIYLCFESTVLEIIHRQQLITVLENRVHFIFPVLPSFQNTKMGKRRITFDPIHPSVLGNMLKTDFRPYNPKRDGPYKWEITPRFVALLFSNRIITGFFFQRDSRALQSKTRMSHLARPWVCSPSVGFCWSRRIWCC